MKHLAANGRSGQPGSSPCPGAAAALFWLGVTRGILASFVGLLFNMTIRFAAAVPWDAVKVLFGIAMIVALAGKVNILHVVLIGSAFSIVLSR